MNDKIDESDSKSKVLDGFRIIAYILWKCNLLTLKDSKELHFSITKLEGGEN